MTARLNAAIDKLLAARQTLLDLFHRSREMGNDEPGEALLIADLEAGIAGLMPVLIVEGADGDGKTCMLAEACGDEPSTIKEALDCFAAGAAWRGGGGAAPVFRVERVPS